MDVCTRGALHLIRMLELGHYEYPFELELPMSLPQTFHAKHMHCILDTCADYELEQIFGHRATDLRTQIKSVLWWAPRSSEKIR